MIILPIIQEKLYRKILILLFGIFVGHNVKIGEGLVLPHPNGIVIGNNVIIGTHVTIYQQVTIGRKNGCYPIVRGGSILYPGCKILGGIIVDRGTKVGANAVLLKSTEYNSTYVGIPAKKCRRDRNDV